MFPKSNQPSQSNFVTGKKTLNSKPKQKTRTSPRTSRRDTTKNRSRTDPGSNSDRSRSRSRLRNSQNRPTKREGLHMWKKSESTQKKPATSIKTVLRSSALDGLTKTRRQQQPAFDGPPSSETVIDTTTEDKTEEEPRRREGDTDSIDEILANSPAVGTSPAVEPVSLLTESEFSSPSVVPPSTMDRSGQSQSITFFPPSNQLEMMSDPTTAESNSGNTFPVVSPEKQGTAGTPAAPPTINEFADLLDSTRLDRFATKSDFEGVIKQVNQNTSLIS